MQVPSLAASTATHCRPLTRPPLAPGCPHPSLFRAAIHLALLHTTFTGRLPFPSSLSPSSLVFWGLSSFDPQSHHRGPCRFSFPRFFVKVCFSLPNCSAPTTPPSASSPPICNWRPRNKVPSNQFARRHSTLPAARRKDNGDGNPEHPFQPITSTSSLADRNSILSSRNTLRTLEKSRSERSQPPRTIVTSDFDSPRLLVSHYNICCVQGQALKCGNFAFRCLCKDSESERPRQHRLCQDCSDTPTSKPPPSLVTYDTQLSHPNALTLLLYRATVQGVYGQPLGPLGTLQAAQAIHLGASQPGSAASISSRSGCGGGRPKLYRFLPTAPIPNSSPWRLLEALPLSLQNLFLTSFDPCYPIHTISHFPSSQFPSSHPVNHQRPHDHLEPSSASSRPWPPTCNTWERRA